MCIHPFSQGALYTTVSDLPYIRLSQRRVLFRSNPPRSGSLKPYPAGEALNSESSEFRSYHSGLWGLGFRVQVIWGLGFISGLGLKLQSLWGGGGGLWVPTREAEVTSPALLRSCRCHRVVQTRSLGSKLSTSPQAYSKDHGT